MNFNSIMLIIVSVNFLQISSCMQINIGKETLYNGDYDENKYENLDKFHKTIHKYHNDLAKKYEIKEFAFDVECIYSAKDLSELVTNILNFAEIDGKMIEEGYTSSNKRYSSVFEVNDEKYKFTTTAQSDYVEFEDIQPHLDTIVKKLKPEFEFNYSNADGGQIAMMIFANSKKLREAVNEGFPCTLEENTWRWENDEWKWVVYTDIELKEMPKFEDLKLKYYKTTEELSAKGFLVPKLTKNRIYITDLFKDNQIHVIIDGNSFQSTPNEIRGNTVRCFWDSWNVLLAYVLVKEFDGKPSLYDKNDKKTMILTKDEYLRKVEEILTKNK